MEKLKDIADEIVKMEKSKNPDANEIINLIKDLSPEEIFQLDELVMQGIIAEDN